MKNLGEKIAKVAQPIARGIDAVFGTDLRNCQGCKGRQHSLNELSNAFYDHFFSKPTTERSTNMQFIVTRQIAIEAETPEEAIAKLAQGNTISLSVNARPQPLQRPQPQPTPQI